jgi:hypothetical protein
MLEFFSWACPCVSYDTQSHGLPLRMGLWEVVRERQGRSAKVLRDKWLK